MRGYVCFKCGGWGCYNCGGKGWRKDPLVEERQVPMDFFDDPPPFKVGDYFVAVGPLDRGTGEIVGKGGK